MNTQEHLLQILAEECNELAVEISKAQRFGLEHRKTFDDIVNSEKIVYEFNDLLATFKLLEEYGVIHNNDDVMKKQIIDKIKKVKHHMEYSKKLGKLED